MLNILLTWLLISWTSFFWLEPIGITVWDWYTTNTRIMLTQT